MKAPLPHMLLDIISGCVNHFFGCHAIMQWEFSLTDDQLMLYMTLEPGNE